MNNNELLASITCYACLNVAFDTALEGMIEILLDDEIADDYDEARALVIAQDIDLWENVAEILDAHDHFHA